MRSRAFHCESLGVLFAALSLAACGVSGPDAGSATAGAAATSESAATGEDAPPAVDAADHTAAAGRLAILEHRRSLIRDANEIKRLQRIYGYYLDQGMWDEVADLFSTEGTIEFGLDGVYAGRERVREYLFALGDGRDGLPAGTLNEHMQLMPVVTVAPDGMTAQGRWRDLMLIGRHGQDAHWGEGPYENDYVKEDGVWKFARVHWYQSVVVPYEGGWQVNEDSNGGHWVPETMSPDAPPSVAYETWPGTYLPPFHFPNPVLNGTPTGADAIAAAPPYTGDTDLPTLAARTAELRASVARLEDENAVENLQRIYGFYLEEGLWSEAASLFTDDGTIERGGSGVYAGRDRVLAYLRTLGQEGPTDGRLFDHMQLQPVVHVAPDGQTAQGRWRLFAQEAQHGEFAHWGVGVYENTYAKVDGVWRIASVREFPKMYTTYEDGWGKTALPEPGPSSELPPDRPGDESYERYPGNWSAPFHYPHPVNTAESEATAAGAQSGPGNVDALLAELDELERRIGRLEDFDALERLNAVYGYYLARNQWDDLAGIFAPDGTIEIAMRGVYAGSEGVRRNLNLYGEQGIHHGLLHNHMQYQPVIHIDAGGDSARMRSRAFSIMGEHETYSMWMGGVYENVYVKRDGIWQILKDQVFNTYFVPYTVGWEAAVPRPPPGITESNPPDSPPTRPFEMYPTAFLPPFSYPNPVTGEEVVWERDP